MGYDTCKLLGPSARRVLRYKVFCVTYKFQFPPHVPFTFAVSSKGKFATS